MQYTNTFNIKYFPFSTTAQEHIDLLAELNKLDDAERFIETIFCDSEVLPTENDIDAFIIDEFDQILTALDLIKCENCQDLIDLSKGEFVSTPHSRFFCCADCAEKAGLNHCNHCGECHYCSFETQENNIFCSASCFDSFTDISTEEYQHLETVENLFPKDLITIEFLQAQENLSFDEQLSVNTVIELLKNN